MILDEAFTMKIQAELQALVEDGDRNEMSFPTDYDNTQRRYIHSLAQKYGLFSKSNGKGDARFIHVAKVKKNAQMQQLSIRVNAMPMNSETHEWFPFPMQQYLQKFPIDATKTQADPWSAKASAAVLTATRARRSAPPLFKALGKTKKRSETALIVAPEDMPGADLPVARYRQQILEYVNSNQIIVISGDTGCGKSTQIPQFLLDDALANGKGDTTRIICSQPRRLSAISLAERVARERSGFEGRDPKEVGHAIRFDSQFDADRSKLIFCTTGTLLKWLNADPYAHGFSHLILDEVHERDQFTDFLLILLKTCILPQRKNLKVILMSATIQVEKFAAYFRPQYSAPIIEMVGGRCFPVTTLFLEDVLALLNANPSTGGSNATHSQKRDSAYITEDTSMANDLVCTMCNYRGFANEEEFGMHVATCFGEVMYDDLPEKSAAPAPKRSKKEKKSKKESDHSADVVSFGETVQTILADVEDGTKESLLVTYMKQGDAISRDQSVDYDLLLQLLDRIDQLFPLDGAGAILVFLPGWEEISYLERALLRSSYTAFKYEIALLHSRLSAQEQRKAFMKPPHNKRKLILATNIAETSLTIADVVFVIDCGKSKQAHALATSASSSFVMGLQTTWVAKANCVQRTGRAGRVRPGICFRLFSQNRYDTSMKEFMLPELLTTPLEELLLHVKLMQYDNKLPINDAKEFLMEAMDSPSENSINTALQRLDDMNALDGPEGQLTLLGWHLAHICNGGVAVQMGKMMLWGHVFGCLDTILQTTCALSGYRDPFISFLGMAPEEQRQVEASKLAILRDAALPIQSDHFILMKAFGAFLAYPSRSYADSDAFCRRNMLHRPTLEQMQAIYRQLQRDLESLGVTPATQLIEAGGRDALTSFFMALSAGLYPNALFVDPTVASRNWNSKEKVKVRFDSSSVLSKPTKTAKTSLPLEWALYHEMMQSDRIRVAKYGTKLPSLLLVLLLMGNHDGSSIEKHEAEKTDEELQEAEANDSSPPEYRWRLIVDEWIVFELQTEEEAQTFVTLRKRLHAAFHRHLGRLHSSFHDQPDVDHANEDLLKQHDEALVRALVAWLTTDLHKHARDRA